MSTINNGKLTDDDLKHFIETRHIEAELIYPGAPTPTVPAAAEALGVPVDAIIKSLVFVADGKPYVLIAAGESRISTKRVRDVLGVSRRKLSMVSPEEALELTGYEVGAMPPFGHRQVLPTLLDSLTVQKSELYGGGGTKQAMLSLRYETLLEVTQAQCVPLTMNEEEG